ncbi:uncharacterized protein LOC121740518 [Aricia agestis]|uniref:uncharacterized protein LOC121740518 n=1 Tax=Aricia agestis TaxID=91739 RepID=UPI001C208808|nr:uncharacterized protein LOC121740518 [Aricia agestis]
MFVNSVEVISSKLNNINLDYNINLDRSNMHPKETHVCGKNQLPLLNITPSNTSQKGSEGSSSVNNPYLLKPNHVIPATPPPQIERKSDNVFLQRIG